MMIEFDPDEEEFNRQQVQKNRQALILVFILMVTLVFIGDTQDQAASQSAGRSRRRPMHGGLGDYGGRPLDFNDPLNFESHIPVPLDAQSFEDSQAGFYAFRTINPPSIWSTIDNEFRDGRVVVHNPTDRPLLTSPVLFDLEKCHFDNSGSLREDPTTTSTLQCSPTSYHSQPSGILDFSLFNGGLQSKIDDDKSDGEKLKPARLVKSTTCTDACQVYERCFELKGSDDEPLGQPTCLPSPLTTDVGIRVDAQYLFYYSVTPEDQFKSALDLRVKCTEKLKVMEPMLGPLDGQGDDADETIPHLRPRARTPFLFDENGSYNPNRTTFENENFIWPLCGIRIDETATREAPDGSIQTKMICQTFTNRRDVSNPFFLMPLGDSFAKVGLNAFGNITIVTYKMELLGKDFETGFAAQVSPRASVDPQCHPEINPVQRLIHNSFNGLRTGFIFPPDITSIDVDTIHPQLTIVGDGGLWYTSRITIDLVSGWHSEDTIYGR